MLVLLNNESVTERTQGPTHGYTSWPITFVNGVCQNFATNRKVN